MFCCVPSSLHTTFNYIPVKTKALKSCLEVQCFLEKYFKSFKGKPKPKKVSSIIKRPDTMCTPLGFRKCHILSASSQFFFFLCSNSIVRYYTENNRIKNKGRDLPFYQHCMGAFNSKTTAAGSDNLNSQTLCNAICTAVQNLTQWPVRTRIQYLLFAIHKLHDNLKAKCCASLSL